MSLMDAAYQLDPALWIDDYKLIQDKSGRPVELDEVQREILRSGHKRIIINCHRQWGKSSLASALCFHRALYYPKSLCLLVSPSLRQSSENFRKILDALDCFDPRPRLDEDTRLTLKLENGSRIISLPGSQKTVRGFSAPDLIFIDEAAQAADELFDALLPMMAGNPRGRIIQASTPWGKRGSFYKTWVGESPGWHRVQVRAQDNLRLSPPFLEEMRAELGDFKYKQEFECEFLELESAFFSGVEVESIFSSAIQPLWGGRTTAPLSGVLKPLWSEGIL